MTIHFDEPLWEYNRVMNRLLQNIHGFQQFDGEALEDAWIRMKDMLQNCPGHRLMKGEYIQIFYHGLELESQEILNALSGGFFLYNTPNQAYQMLEDNLFLSLNGNFQNTRYHQSTYTQEDYPPPAPKQDDSSISSLRKMIMEFMADQKESEDFIKAQVGTLKLNMEQLRGDVEQELRDHEASIQNLAKKLEKIEEKEEARSTLPSNTQSNLRSTQPTSKSNLSPPTSNEHDIHIRSDLENDVKIMKHEEEVTIPTKEVPVVPIIPIVSDTMQPCIKIGSTKRKFEEALGIFSTDENSKILESKIPIDNGDPMLFRFDKKKRVKIKESMEGEETSLFNKSFEEVEVNDGVISKVKFDYFSPYKFRPPDMISVGVSETPP